MTNEIPSELEVFEEGEEPKFKVGDGSMYFQVEKGQFVEIVAWYRYPNYDFMFGVPTKESKYYELEVAFFGYRNKNGKKIGQFYDCSELENLIEGFMAVQDISKKINPNIWTTRKQ